MKLSPTAYVILGMLSWRPMSGYDIKSLADGSTRFFWAISYGQIYPELRHLAAADLVEAAKAEGGRRRKVYRLTAKGRKALREWLAERPETFETRDEGLLKLFFASANPASAIGALEGKRDYHARKLEELRAIEATGKPQGFALRVLRGGIEMSEWTVAWCERAIAELEKDQEEAA
jgi:PadR family transcriptional regulator, regulatory protein AphA